MAEAAIFKSRKTAMTLQWFDRSALLALRTGPAVKISNFLKPRMANGRHLKLKAVNS